MTNDKNILEHIIRSCNPPPKQFYNSKMLENGGRLLINKVPKNLDKIIKTNDFQKISED